MQDAMEVASAALATAQQAAETANEAAAQSAANTQALVHLAGFVDQLAADTRARFDAEALAVREAFDQQHKAIRALTAHVEGLWQAVTDLSEAVVTIGADVTDLVNELADRRKNPNNKRKGG
jgi:hypothetical protein